MSEEQLKELQEYNLEYLEAQSSEEIFGGDYTSAVELKYAKKEIERLNNIINRIESIYQSLCFSAPENTYIFIEQLGDVLQELKGSDKK